MILLLSYIFLGIAHGLDPIVIERPTNKVEWGDMLLEYDPSQAPTNNITVALSFLLNIL